MPITIIHLGAETGKCNARLLNKYLNPKVVLCNNISKISYIYFKSFLFLVLAICGDRVLNPGSKENDTVK